MESYLREASGGETVLLKQHVLTYKIVLMKNGIPRQVPDEFGYTVPFVPQLQQLLNCRDVLDCVDNPLPSTSGVYRTVTDGLYYRYHPVVQEHGPTTLAIYIHVDDADPCEALKSKSGKNNLRLFYWCLGNIYPEKRSSLKAINLLAIAKAKVCKKYGNEFLIRDFVDTMKKLGSEGVELNIRGELRRFYAVLIFATCDNPAAANLGKFKETHAALRPCRACMIKSSDMCQHFREDASLLRKKLEHEEQVEKVIAQKKPGDIVEVINVYKDVAELMEDFEEDCDVENVYSDHINPSINFGINGKCILSEIPHFDVTKCLPQDIMHLLNEGVVETVCRLLLKDLCLPPAPRVKPLIPLADLNKAIDSLCDLGHMKASKPSEIEKGHLTGHKLKQSASQMLVLLRLLPFIIFNRCPEAKLQLLLKLIHMVDLCMAYIFCEVDLSKLEKLIEEFGNAFKILYPGVKTLKLHCIVHLVTQVRLHGPLRQSWCFRFEAMHSKFTNIFDVVRSMKNPSKTAALRHLDSRNAEISECKGENYLSENDGPTGLKKICIADLPEKDCLSETFPGLLQVTQVNQFTHRGSIWHEGVNMVLEREGNMFGRIQGVYMVDNDVFFTYNFLKTEYIAHYNAHQILKCEQEYHTISFAELNHKFPMWRISFKFPKTLKSFIIVQNPVNSF